VPARLATLQIGSPLALEIHATWVLAPDLAREVESKAHRRLRHDRLHGEWFTSSLAQISACMAEILIEPPAIATSLSRAVAWGDRVQHVLAAASSPADLHLPGVHLEETGDGWFRCVMAGASASFRWPDRSSAVFADG